MKKTLEVRKTLQSEFEKFRNAGYNQKQCAFMIGVTEKTAGAYERLRKEKNIKKIAELEDLIKRLKTRADKPHISTTELIELTSKLESLFIKKEKLTDYF